MPFNSADLVRASQDGDIGRVTEVLASGVDVNSQNEHGMGSLLTFVPTVDPTRDGCSAAASANHFTSPHLNACADHAGWASCDDLRG